MAKFFLLLTLVAVTSTFAQQASGDSATIAPKKLLPASSAEELDQLWANFLQNKDAESFIRIYKSLAFCSERKDIQIFVIGASAKNSLIANGKQSKAIVKILESFVDKSSGDLKIELEDVLTKIKRPKGLEEYRSEVSKIVAEIAENNKKK
jgi:hypothetical protein